MLRYLPPLPPTPNKLNLKTEERNPRRILDEFLQGSLSSQAPSLP